MAEIRPVPVVTSTNAPYFLGAKHGTLSLQRCSNCGRFVFYPRVACPYCFQTESLQWVVASGRGTVQSFSLIYRPQNPAFTEEVPIVLAAVALEEGPTMLSVIRIEDRTAVHIGMPVVSAFESLTEEIALPVWRPVGSHATLGSLSRGV